MDLNYIPSIINVVECFSNNILEFYVSFMDLFIHDFSETKALHKLRALFIYVVYGFSPVYSLILF